jgi:RNA polymerase sigma-70 factor (ECF subfamily)
MVEAFDSRWQAARAAWPGVDVAEEEFSAYVAERMDSAKAAGKHAALCTEDLYLACACARGDRAALSAFERAFFEEIPRAMKRTRASALPASDELAQVVRHKLFVADLGARPKIAEYGGRGNLRSWFRVVLSRMILNLATRPSPEVPLEQDILVSLLGGADISDVDVEKESYRSAFRDEFAPAFAALADRDKSLLRYAFGEGLTVESIGALYGVHKTTAARWVLRSHEALLAAVRARVMTRLGIGEEEYASVLRMVQSRLEISIERYLKTPDA